MKKIILVVFMQMTCFVSGQAPLIEWQKCFGGTSFDFAHSIQPTPDGGYIIAGTTSSIDGDVRENHGGQDAIIYKISNTGSLQWQKAMGGTGDDQAYCVHPTPDGGYILAGITTSKDGDVTGNHGFNDAWVVKLSSTGDLQWQKCLGGTNTDYARMFQPTPDGGYIIVGTTASNNGDVTGNHGGFDAWVLKISNTGALLWQTCLGGTNEDVAESIQPTSDGGYIMAGRTYSNNGNVTGSHGGVDAWVVKLNSIGDLQWQQCTGGTGSDYATSIQPTPDGGYIMAGYTYSTDGDVTGNHGSSDFWVVKLSNTGVLQWQKCLGGTNYDQAFFIQPTPDGGYIIGGDTSNNNGDVKGNHGGTDAWVVKLDTTGYLQWQKCLGGTGDDRTNKIQLTTDGGYIMAGHTSSIDGDVSGSIGEYDAWVVKLNAQGLSYSKVENNNNFGFSPNPAQTKITFSEAINNLEVFDITGKKVKAYNNPSSSYDVSTLQKGLYILKGKTSEGKSITEKLVKE